MDTVSLAERSQGSIREVQIPGGLPGGTGSGDVRPRRKRGACGCGAPIKRSSVRCRPCENRSRIGKQRLPDQHVQDTSTFCALRAGAAHRGVPWGLTREETLLLTASPCSYCGQPPSNRSKLSYGRVRTGSGIDRVDNGLGYVPGNVVSCCWLCNRAKGPLPLADFLAWLQRVAAFRSRACQEVGL